MSGDKKLSMNEWILILAILGIIVFVGIVIFGEISSRECIVKAEEALTRIAREENQYKAHHGAYPPRGTHVDYLPFFGGKGRPGSGRQKVKVGDYIIFLKVQTPQSFVAVAVPARGSKMVYHRGERCTGWLQIDQAGKKNSQSVPNGWPRCLGKKE